MATISGALLIVSVGLLPHAPAQANHGGDLSNVDWGSGSHIIARDYSAANHQGRTASRKHSNPGCSSNNTVNSRGWLTESNWNNHFVSFDTMAGVGQYVRCQSMKYIHYIGNGRCGNTPTYGWYYSSTRNGNGLDINTSCVEWR